jgi:hypothetical protein
MQRFRQVVLMMFIMFIVLGPLILGWVPSRSYAAPPVVPAIQGASTTPFQNALAASLSQRRAAGLPVPVVTTDQQVTGSPELAAGGITPGLTPGSGISPYTVVTTTTLYFAGPEQAGYQTWPRLVIDESMDPGGNGTVAVGDYTDQYRAAIAAQSPGFWDQYEFGYEPRTYIITETLGYSVSGSPARIPAGEVTTTEDILMGFTYTGPHWLYYIEEELWTPTVPSLLVFYFKAGFELDWAFGLRLPAEVSLSGPATVEVGDSYYPAAVLNPLDWSADDYTQAGVAAEDGNEYLMRFAFFIGVQGTVLGEDICPSCYWERSFDESASFTTPLGPGDAFPLTTVNIAIFEYSIPFFSFAINLGLQPQLGSSRITADWRALPSSHATGSGSVAFTSAGTPVPLGEVVVTDQGSGNKAKVELSNFQYWFDQFLIEILASLDFQLFGYGVWNPEVSIYTFDLSVLTQITGLDSLSVGRHTQCDWLFNCGFVGPDNVLVLSSLLPSAGAAGAAAAPSAPLCADLNGTTTETIRAYVPPDTVTDGSVFCRSLVENSVFVQDSAEIGKPEVLERGVIQAVDVFALFHDGSPTAWFNHAPTICLRGSGTLLYLDATAAPRTVAELPVYVQSGYTCGSIPNAGTVVLVNDSPTVINTAPNPTSAGTTAALNDCMVTTSHIVNLRTQPDANSPVVRMVPYNVTLTAFERSAGWFYVDYIGSRGWVSAEFVSPQGSCG